MCLYSFSGSFIRILGFVDLEPVDVFKVSRVVFKLEGPSDEQRSKLAKFGRGRFTEGGTRKD